MNNDFASENTMHLFRAFDGGEIPLLCLIVILFNVLIFSQGQFDLDHN